MIQSKDNLDSKILLLDAGHIKVEESNQWADDVFNKFNFSSLNFKTLCAGLLETKIKSEDYLKENSYTTPEIKNQILFFNKIIYNKFNFLESVDKNKNLKGKTKIKKLIYEEILYYVDIINKNIKVFNLVDKNKKEYEFLKNRLVKKYENRRKRITRKSSSTEDRSLISMAFFLSSLPNYKRIIVYSPDSDIYGLYNLILKCPNFEKYNLSKIKVINTTDHPIPFNDFFNIEFNSKKLSMNKIKEYLIKENYYQINN